MTILTKQELYNAALTALKSGDYPEINARVAVGDVTITQQLAAQAQMLAMLSYQLGLAEVEPWIKARDNMVLADAALRGVLPYAKAACYAANVINQGVHDISLTAGRKLLDNKGRIWEITDGAIIPRGSHAIIHIAQHETTEKIHQVKEEKSFYQINVAPPNSDNYLLDISVKDENGEYFKYAEKFNNVEPNERVYHIIADEMMNIAVQFGLKDIIGYVPKVDEKIIIVTRYTGGNVSLENATPLDLEYLQENEENLIILSGEQIQAGAEPFSIDDLREITNYPSLYDNNAVFLGEFKFIVQRKLSPFVFLNVWNERQEEMARGANVDNINTLFVSFLKDGIQNEEAQNQISRIIHAADNSYRIKFVSTVEQKININIQLTLAPMHDEGSVRKQIKVHLIKQYGKNSSWARQGNQRINWQNTIKYLRENITQLQDGISDIAITIEQTQNTLPETFAYVAEDSININAIKLY